jgi:hypothetical protein
VGINRLIELTAKTGQSQIDVQNVKSRTGIRRRTISLLKKEASEHK